MPLRVRIGLGFALVALATAAMVAAASPQIVGQGLSELESEIDARATGPGLAIQATEPAGETESAETGAAVVGESPTEDESAEALAAVRAAEAREQVQQGTVERIALVALLAALVASLAGLVVSGRLTRPLRRLEAAAQAVAAGDLGRRSGLADRRDEFGELGRSFDSMAAELEQAEATRRRFLQDAVHELRTPLTVIDATASAILDGVYPADRSHLETIREQSMLLSRIVDDLRTISLAEGGQLPLRLERVDVGAALVSSIRGFAAPAAERQIRLDLRGGADLAVTADSDRFRQIVGALVDNAVRHSPSGGRIEIEAAPIDPAHLDTAEAATAGAAVRVSVTDEGPGIPEVELERIFDRFYQGDPGPDRPKGTSGLGLSIVHALVQAQGGVVGAENVAPHGLRVWFELPAVR